MNRFERVCLSRLGARGVFGRSKSGRTKTPTCCMRIATSCSKTKRYVCTGRSSCCLFSPFGTASFCDRCKRKTCEHLCMWAFILFATRNRTAKVRQQLEADIETQQKAATALRATIKTEEGIIKETGVSVCVCACGGVFSSLLGHLSSSVVVAEALEKMRLSKPRHVVFFMGFRDRDARASCTPSTFT